jgi:hypothetical protein
MFTVYHGTVGAHANDIDQHGIQLAKCGPKSDFAPGFYTTRILEQAVEFANERYRQVADDHANDPALFPDPLYAAVLEFNIVLDALGDVATLAFVQPIPDWLDFVKYCRRPHRVHKGTSKLYDAVYGPVLDVGADTAIDGWEQISFHTDYSVSLLQIQRHATRRGGPYL